MKPPRQRPPPGPDPGDATDLPGLESLLASQRLRPPPAEWRESILRRAAASASASEPATETSRDRVNGQRRHPESFHGAAPAIPWLQRLVAHLSSGWSLTAAAWILAFALNQYSIPRGAFTAAPRQPPFSEAALAEIRESQRALGDFANLGAVIPSDFHPPQTHRAPPDAASPVPPALPSEPRPRARLPRGFRDGHVARSDTNSPHEPEPIV
ncbi:MAG: hypothetical protein JNK85_26160 [Verrucomicrobiales bacterium]|nr:hypothetical protein [Verrucomicrobiales bacterium]